jgi:predicted DNA-binding protein with PD1-like motif
MEICSLEGTLTPERSHLHIVLGREDGSAIAGHLMGKHRNYRHLSLRLGRKDG